MELTPSGRLDEYAGSGRRMVTFRIGILFPQQSSANLFYPPRRARTTGLMTRPPIWASMQTELTRIPAWRPSRVPPSWGLSVISNSRPNISASPRAWWTRAALFESIDWTVVGLHLLQARGRRVTSWAVTGPPRRPRSHAGRASTARTRAARTPIAERSDALHGSALFRLCRSASGRLPGRPLLPGRDRCRLGSADPSQLPAQFSSPPVRRGGARTRGERPRRSRPTRSVPGDLLGPCFPSGHRRSAASPQARRRSPHGR